MPISFNGHVFSFVYLVSQKSLQFLLNRWSTYISQGPNEWFDNKVYNKNDLKNSNTFLLTRACFFSLD
jgi:hypothetical protein